MNQTLATSDSIVASLCREIESIRCRYRTIVQSLDSCKDNPLKHRLNLELDKLQIRKRELSSISKNFHTGNKKGDLSILFLLELCQRPLEVRI